MFRLSSDGSMDGVVLAAKWAKGCKRVGTKRGNVMKIQPCFKSMPTDQSFCRSPPRPPQKRVCVQLKLCCCKSQESGSSMMTWAKLSVAPQREDVCVWLFLKTKQTIMLHDVQQLAVRIHHHFNSNSVIQFLHRTILAHPPAQLKTARRQILFSGFRLHPRSAWRRARGASDHLQVDKGRKCNPVAYRGAWNPYHHHLVGKSQLRDRDRYVSWKKLRLQVACRNQPKDQKIGGKNIRIGTGRHYTIPFFEIMEAF